MLDGLLQEQIDESNRQSGSSPNRHLLRGSKSYDERGSKVQLKPRKDYKQKQLWQVVFFCARQCVVDLFSSSLVLELYVPLPFRPW